MTVDAPAQVTELFEPVDQPMTPGQSGEHAADLTPNAALIEPVDGLTIDTNTENLVSSHRRRASVGEDTPARKCLLAVDTNLLYNEGMCESSM